jgi:Na+-transporting NADH:ubiquinone oxidoreductase subunit E
MVIRNYDFTQTVFYGLGAGLGWFLAILLMAGLREKMGYANVPRALRRTGIVMLMAGVIAMTFMGFTGMLSTG